MKVLRDRAAICSAVVLVLFFAVAVLDSLHFRRALAHAPRAATRTSCRHGAHAPNRCSMCFLERQIAGRETSYSAPLSIRGFTKDSVEVNGQIERTFPRLKYGGEALADDTQWVADLLHRVGIGLFAGIIVTLVCRSAGSRVAVARANQVRFVEASRMLLQGRTDLPLRAVVVTMLALCVTVRPAVGAGSALPCLRHRSHRQRRVLPGAKEHSHRVRDRHAVHHCDPAARSRVGDRVGLSARLGRRTGAVPLHRAVVDSERAC